MKKKSEKEWGNNIKISKHVYKLRCMECMQGSLAQHNKSPRIQWDINNASQSLSAAAEALTGD